MDEIIRQGLYILRGMWRFRWPAVALAWVVALVGAIIVMRVPNQYEASARIYVDTQSILKPLMAGLTIQPNVDQQVAMLSRTLISRPNLEKLVRMADLDLKAGTKSDQDAIIDRLARDVQIRNTGRDNLYTLAFRESDREKAKRVVQSLVSIFVESSLGAQRKDTDSAKSFLTEQIKQYEAKLEEAETRLKEFRVRNIERQSPDGKDAMTLVSEAANQLRQAQLELREAEDARNAVKSQLAAERNQAPANPAAAAAAEAAVPVATPEIDGRIDAQKRNLDSLQQRFTDQHPEIIITKRLIRELEEQRTKEQAELRKAAAAAAAANPTTASGGGNVAVQELNRMLAAAEAQVAGLKARVGEYSARLGAAREGLKTAPQVEAEAAQLNRDYEIIRKTYQDLVARRQAALMSGDLDVASGVADFRLIDPPRVTPQPVAPNRMLLMAGVLLAAVAAGLGLSVAASQLRPVFTDGDQLRTVTGLPLLGAVSMIVSDVERRRERLRQWWFYGASGGLVGTFALGITVLALLSQRGG